MSPPRIATPLMAFVALAAIVLASCSPGSSISTSATSSSPPPTATATPLSSVEPTPNTGPAISLVRGCDNPPQVQPVVTITGELVVRAVGTWSVRRVSPAGLDRIRQEVLNAPLLQTSGEYPLQRLPVSTGAMSVPVHGFCTYAFTIGSGPDAIVVRSGSWNGDAEEDQFYLPSPERKELDRLANRLANVGDWLATEGWADATWSPYAGTSFLLWIDPQLGQAPEGIPSSAGVAWPFAGPIDSFGDLVGPGRCGYLAPSVASEIVRLLQGLGIDGRLDAATAVTGLRTENGWVRILLTPRAPGGFPSCADEAPFQF